MIYLLLRKKKDFFEVFFSSLFFLCFLGDFNQKRLFTWEIFQDFSLLLIDNLSLFFSFLPLLFSPTSTRFDEIILFSNYFCSFYFSPSAAWHNPPIMTFFFTLKFLILLSRKEGKILSCIKKSSSHWRRDEKKKGWWKFRILTSSLSWCACLLHRNVFFFEWARKKAWKSFLFPMKVINIVWEIKIAIFYPRK